MKMVSGKNKKRLVYGVLIGLLWVGMLMGCAPKNTGDSALPVPGMISSTHADAKMLKPGVSVLYTYGYWRHVNQMPNTAYFKKYGKTGDPITSINHRFGRGKVFGSGQSQGVGILMEGFILLEKSGVWEFKVRSNDGIEVFVNNTQVVNDPEWHSDRFSSPRELTTKEPGYYPFLLQYFQRKGTATLEFYWKPPGEKDFTIVPESAYWH